MRGLENAGKTAGRHKTSQYDRFYKVFHLLDGWRNFYSGKALQCWEPTSPEWNKVAKEPSEKVAQRHLKILYHDSSQFGET
jgi:hypothetical protein